jgi:hypothetical protein
MSLTATNVKLDADKLQLAKIKGINVSRVCREALDSRLKLDGDDVDMINQQLVDIEKQMQELALEKKVFALSITSIGSSLVIMGSFLYYDYNINE